MSEELQTTSEGAPRRKQWTIDIERTPSGFRYTFHGLGVVDFESTVDQLARAVERTIRERVR
jgi:hypothetical protein